MTVKDLVINISNLIWTEEVKKAWVSRSAFIVQDFSQSNAAGAIGNGHKYFDIYCGSERIEYGLADCPVYLAAVTRDGRYSLERLEKQLKEQDNGLVFDVLDLPDRINGLCFQKARGFCNTPRDRRFNRPCGNVSFHTGKDSPGLWTIDGWD